MIKKIISFSAALIISLVGLTDNVSAQGMGQWTQYPVFSSGNKRIIDAGKYVYFANTGLFSYDKESHEQYSYTSDNILNGTKVQNIYYNNDRHYLVVAYEDANIDLIYDNGDVANIADILQSDQTPATINDVIFDGNNIFVATNFGIVKLDERRKVVIESGIYNKNVQSLCIMDGKLLIAVDKGIHFIPKNNSIHLFNEFTKLLNCDDVIEMVPLSDDYLLTRGSGSSSYSLRGYPVNFESPSANTQYKTLTSKYIQPFIRCGENIYVVIDNSDNSSICDIDENHKLHTVLNIPEDYKNDLLDASDDISNLWCISEQGVTEINLSPEGDVTVLSDRFMPDATAIMSVNFITPSPDKKRLVMNNVGASFSRFMLDDFWAPLTAVSLDLSSGFLKNISPFPIEANEPRVAAIQETRGKYILGPQFIMESPDEEDTYYMCSSHDGIFKVKNGEKIGGYTNDNSPITSYYRINTFGMFIDREGNMWVTSYASGFSILPAEKRRLDPSQITKEDWIQVDIEGFSGNIDVIFCQPSGSNIMFISCSGSNVILLIAYDTNGTLSDTSDDRYRVWNSFTDQDGRVTQTGTILCMKEDNSGRVWFGTNSAGAFYLTNPAKALDASCTFTHVKVPRNDGTNSADYLLGTDEVMSISVDKQDRKWIASTKSGLYLTNPTGSEILENFTTENSPLSSNRILSVYCDQATNDVYVGTTAGLYKYSATVISSADSFNDVYAYPNPVRPDYPGLVHVRGLMDNSLVKIADASGSVVAQGRAENGSFEWDVCNTAGKRVPTGVYYVLMSQNTNGTSAKVAKILVVN